MYDHWLPMDPFHRQFGRLPSTYVVFGFGDGWNEQEYNPATGVLWRWTTDRSNIRVRAEGHALALTLRGEIEAAKTSHIVIRVGNAVAAAFEFFPRFIGALRIPITPAPPLPR